MTTKFTPGPWKLSADSLFQEFVIVGASTLPVCSLLTAKSAKSASWSNKKVSPRELWGSVADDREQANASLISSAPDILAALERLSFAAECRDNTMGDPCRLIEVKAELAAANRQAIAAITKAKCSEISA